MGDCGHVDEVRFPGNDATKATRGIAFVVLDSHMAARRAVGLTGGMFKERKIRVAPANENRQHNTDPDGKGKGKGKDKDGKGKAKARIRAKVRMVMIFLSKGVGHHLVVL